MLKKKKIKAIYIKEGICDVCGGYMISTGACLTSYPAQYPYKCEKCGWGEFNLFTNTVPLEIHHKDGDYKNNRPENLEVL